MTSYAGEKTSYAGEIHTTYLRTAYDYGDQSCPITPHHHSPLIKAGPNGGMLIGFSTNSTPIAKSI